MKTILATVLILLLGITGILLWGAAHARRMAVSSSQIFVHGMPVCVMQQAGRIVASVGLCGPPGSESPDEEYGNGDAFHGGPFSGPERDYGLPPGHPPVDSLPDFEEGRRTLI